MISCAAIYHDESQSFELRPKCVVLQIFAEEIEKTFNRFDQMTDVSHVLPTMNRSFYVLSFLSIFISLYFAFCSSLPRSQLLDAASTAAIDETLLRSGRFQLIVLTETTMDEVPTCVFHFSSWWIEFLV
jgi:hypothetical protein